MIPLKVLIDQLWHDSNPVNRCQYLSKEGDDCFCKSPQRGAADRVGHFDLQLWCLDGIERHVWCIFHPEYGAVMHSKPMSDSDGDFDPEVKIVNPCPGCGKSDNVFLRLWHSHCGGFEDCRYDCKDCGKAWWVDGPDS